MNEETLKNKNCLVTGATRGLGRQIAVRLVEKGCNLFLTARGASNLVEFKGELESTSSDRQIHVAYEAGDLNNLDDMDRVIKSAKRQMRQIDILVNCAGVSPVISFADSSLEVFETCFNVNVRAPFLLTKAFAPDMVASRWGRIINIGSSSSYQGFRGTSIYCASKHALLGLSRSLHDELKEHNVRTYCISPGSMKTDMGRQVIGQNWDTFMDPQEVAEVTTFLISFDKELIVEEIRLNRLFIS